MPIWLGYIYILLPVLIFVIGWCNLWTAIIGTIVITVSGYFLFKTSPKIWVPESKKDWLLLAGILLVTLIWVYSSGIGALVFQNLDHNCRNAIFELLVAKPWPVITPDNTAILTYYIGFWLPSAVLGKLFNSINLGYIAQIVWAAFGVFLFSYYVLATLKKKSIFPLLLFIFFSGLDIVGVLLTQPKAILASITTHLEWWGQPEQFSSMTTQLFWVFNQAVPAWLITMLLYHQKNNKNIILIYSCMFLTSTLPAIGLLPFIIYWGFANGESDFRKILTKSHLLGAIKNGMTFQNIFGGGVITLVTHSYLSNNIAGGSINILGFPLPISFCCLLALFLFLEAGIYFICTFKFNKNNPLFYISAITLALTPFIKVGFGSDFVMRASIPSLILLYLFVVQTFDKINRKKDGTIFGILLAVLMIGAVTPLHEITRTVVQTHKGITKLAPLLGFENFFGYTENNSFLKLYGKNRFKN